MQSTQTVNYEVRGRLIVLIGLLVFCCVLGAVVSGMYHLYALYPTLIGLLGMAVVDVGGLLGAIFVALMFGANAERSWLHLPPA